MTFRDEDIAASLGAHRDLGPAYDDAIAAGLVERIGAEVDHRVDERISQHQRGDQRHLSAVQHGGQITSQQTVLALGSMAIGAIASIGIAQGKGTWPIIFVWIAIVVINLAIFRGRHFRADGTDRSGFDHARPGGPASSGAP
jgi:hypothetical protein